MSNPTPDQCLSTLLVGGFEQDRLLLHELFRQPGRRLFEARDRRHALDWLKRHAIHVVLAESDLPNWGWKKILGDLQLLPHPPQLVVASRLADDSLWSEVLNLGAYDLLALPLEREEADRVLSAARRRYTDPIRRPARREPPNAAAGVA